MSVKMASISCARNSGVASKMPVTPVVFWAVSAVMAVSYTHLLPTILTTLGLIFYDAWQLSAVTEEEGRARFFTKIFRTYSSVLFLSLIHISAAWQA